MALCKDCIREIEDMKFCPYCGLQQTEDSSSADPSRSSSKSENTPEPDLVVTPESTTNTLPPVYSSGRQTVDSSQATGQVIFSVINIVLGFFCCCFNCGIGLILGIIAAVTANSAKKAGSQEDMEKNLKTARILNIIAIIIIILSLAFFVIYMVNIVDGNITPDPITRSFWEGFEEGLYEYGY